MITTLSLPNLTICISVWYLNQNKPCMPFLYYQPSTPFASNPRLSIPTTNNTQSVINSSQPMNGPTTLQLQQTPTTQTNARKTLRAGGTNKKPGNSNTSRPVMMIPTPIPTRTIPPFALCDLSGHATNNCPSLPELLELMNVDDLELDASTLVVYVSLPELSSKRNKSLWTNHPCALCDNFGHYSHHCPQLLQFRAALAMGHQVYTMPLVAPPPPTKV